MPRKTTATKTKPSAPIPAASPSPARIDNPDDQPKELPLPAVAPGDIVQLKCTKLLYEVLSVYSTNAIAHTHDASLTEEWAELRRQDDGQTAKWKVCQLEKMEG